MFFILESRDFHIFLKFRAYRVPLEALNWFIDVEFTDVDALVSGATSERCIGLPINVEGRSAMETELLSTLAAGGVPNDGGLVDTGAEDVITAFIPFQREYWSFVLSQSTGESTVRCPNARITVVASGCEKSSIALSKKRVKSQKNHILSRENDKLEKFLFSRFHTRK